MKTRGHGKYVIGGLTLINLLFFMAGIVLQEEDILLGGVLFSFMLMVGYYIPAAIASRSVPRDKRYLWIIFFLCLNVAAMAAFWYLFVHETSHEKPNGR